MCFVRMAADEDVFFSTLYGLYGRSRGRDDVSVQRGHDDVVPGLL